MITNYIYVGRPFWRTYKISFANRPNMYRLLKNTNISFSFTILPVPAIFRIYAEILRFQIRARVLMVYYEAYDTTYGSRINNVHATHKHIIINSFKARVFLEGEKMSRSSGIRVDFALFVESMYTVRRVLRDYLSTA